MLKMFFKNKGVYEKRILNYTQINRRHIMSVLPTVVSERDKIHTEKISPSLGMHQ
jgi:hypothetical protein